VQFVDIYSDYVFIKKNINQSPMIELSVHYLWTEVSYVPISTVVVIKMKDTLLAIFRYVQFKQNFENGRRPNESLLLD